MVLLPRPRREGGPVPCTFRIVNAGQSSYPGGWWDYRACASHDGETWFRVPTEHDGGPLTIHHTPESDVIAFACFAPYPRERHEALLDKARSSPRASVIKLGKSVEGRPMSVLSFGDQGRSVRRVWIIAHQHPGETMAAWFVEGLVHRLLDAGDAVAGALLDKAQIYVVPDMNPDGSARGNHRTNAAGRDLNREWLYPSPEASPEVFLVRQAMMDGGIDMLLDVHGEEALPYVFAFGVEGIPDYSERLASLDDLFARTLQQIDGDFQRERGYDPDPPGGADLRLATDYCAQRFGCLAVGLEMPFKDNVNRRNEAVGWSPERCRGFARSVVEAVLACVDALR